MPENKLANFIEIENIAYFTSLLKTEKLISASAKCWSSYWRMRKQSMLRDYCPSARPERVSRLR